MFTISPFNFKIARRVFSGGAFAATLAATIGAFQIGVEAQGAKTSAPPTPYTQAFVRDPKIPIDQEYTAKIKEYTTQPFFTSPLVDYLPASKNVPTPKAVLGDVAGAPGKLPYAEEVYQYMRMLEKAAPQRVKVFSIGKTEEGREMIAVAISSEANMAKLEENRLRLAKLGDPRTINLDDAQAETLVQQSTPIYYITGTIHSPETGAPTALMELAYRLDRRRSRVHQVGPQQSDDADHAGGRGGRPRQDGRHLQMASGASRPELAEPRLLGKVCRARQQSRCDGRDAEAHARTC